MEATDRVIFVIDPARCDINCAYLVRQTSAATK